MFNFIHSKSSAVMSRLGGKVQKNYKIKKISERVMTFTKQVTQYRVFIVCKPILLKNKK